MKYKILIVDDEEMILSMMKKCLKEEFLVYTADNARNALELLKIEPDMILLDINMPEMDWSYYLALLGFFLDEDYVYFISSGDISRVSYLTGKREVLVEAPQLSFR